VLMLALTVMPAAAFNPTKSPQRKAAHMITFLVHEKDENGEEQTGRAQCTASALGNHALLTADHCDMGETTIHVDKELVDRAIFGRIKDGEDHVIFLVGGSAFKDTMANFYSPDTYKMDNVGDEIFLYGDGQGMYPPAYRQGRVMGAVTIPQKDIDSMLITDPNVYMFDLNIIGGDSGSAIYDKRTGKLITLVTYSMADHFCGSYIMKFTQAQVEQAEKF